MCIPEFPASAPITLEAEGQLQGILGQLADGISEFSFAGLYLFRSKYNYRISLSGGALLVFGEYNGKSFFVTPASLPPEEALDELLKTRDEWKLISPSLLKKEEAFFARLAQKGFAVIEDRDNFDYLYSRRDLAELPGKAFHKKKNRVNAFIKAHEAIAEAPLTAGNAPAAREVLAAWGAAQEDAAATDFKQAQEALEAIEHGVKELTGLLVYADGIPTAYCVAELFAQNAMATVHFEKARPDSAGAFQYINLAFARSLSDDVLLVNREQDMGDEGLRQAKMTYRPCGFAKKHLARRAQEGG